MPELAAVYGLSPLEVWELTRSELDSFLRHHRQLTKELPNG